MPYRAVLAFPLAATLALASCMSLFRDREINPANPLDHSIEEVLLTGRGAAVARARLEESVRNESGAVAVMARLTPHGYRCHPYGRGLLLCRYANHFKLESKSSVSRYRLDYEAEIDPDQSAGKIRRLCVTIVLTESIPERPLPFSDIHCSPN